MIERGTCCEKMYYDIISCSIKVNQCHYGYQVFCIPIGNLVATNYEIMKMNHKGMPIYALNFTIRAELGSILHV